MTTTLLLIDIQNDYFPGGKMELVGADIAAKKAAQLLAAFRQQAWPVVHVQHLANQPDATFFLPSTSGAEIHPLLKPLTNEPVIQKHFPNSFRETQLQTTLQKIGTTTLVIAGSMTHMCIDTTTRAAFDLGYRNQLVHDACATRDLNFGDRTVAAADVHAAYMAALGAVFAQLTSTSDWLANHIK